MRVSCTLNMAPHKQNCWLGRVIKWRSFIRWERSFIPMKLLWLGYLVYSFSSCVMKLYIGTSLIDLALRQLSWAPVAGTRQRCFGNPTAFNMGAVGRACWPRIEEFSCMYRSFKYKFAAPVLITSYSPAWLHAWIKWKSIRLYSSRIEPTSFNLLLGMWDLLVYT